MTVRELIDKLWTLPQDAEVLTPDLSSVYVDTGIEYNQFVVYITDINPEEK